MTTFKSQLHRLAGQDRTATVQTMLEVLSELGALREANATARYDHRAIGAGQAVRGRIAAEIGLLLLSAGAIEFTAKRGNWLFTLADDLPPHMDELLGSLWVVMPSEQPPAAAPIIEPTRQDDASQSTLPRDPTSFEWTDAMYEAFNAIQAQKSHPSPEQLLAAWRALNAAANIAEQPEPGTTSK